VHIGLNTREYELGREFIEDDHTIYTVQGGDDLCPLRGWDNRSSNAFELAH
jgi:hypothetical protein